MERDLMQAAKENWYTAAVLRSVDPELAEFMDGMEDKDLVVFSVDGEWRYNSSDTDFTQRHIDIYRLREDYQPKNKFPVGSVWLHPEWGSVVKVTAVVPNEKHKNIIGFKPLHEGAGGWCSAIVETEGYAKELVPFYEPPTQEQLEEHGYEIARVARPKAGMVAWCPFAQSPEDYKEEELTYNGYRYILKDAKPESKGRWVRYEVRKDCRMYFDRNGIWHMLHELSSFRNGGVEWEHSDGCIIKRGLMSWDAYLDNNIEPPTLKAVWIWEEAE